jgi:fluoride exporter
VRSAHRLRVPVLAVVALGGAVGAELRYLLSTIVPDRSGGFPWTIFAVNVVGCALLALLPSSAAVRRRPLLPPLLGTGVLGGFTTLSTYGEQSRSLAAAGHVVLAGGYVVGTLVACLIAVLVAGHLSSPAAGGSFADEEGDL